MRLRRDVTQLKSLLGYQPWPKLQPINRRQYATQSSELDIATSEYAVLGGGITGLASAYYLSRDLPDAKIALFERSSRLGGWVQSKLVDVGDGEIIFEKGPRSLRPDYPTGPLGMAMAQELGLIDDLLPTSKSSPAAQNRFVYYPDHLVRMPGLGMSLTDLTKSIASEPVFNGFVPSALLEWSKDQRADDLEDESIGSFISRRFGKDIANNIASALFHGIYAGDIWQLSVRSVLPSLWAREGRSSSITASMARQILQKQSWMFMRDVKMMQTLSNFKWEPDTMERMSGCSVYTFKYGLEQLVHALKRWLTARPNVKMYADTEVMNAVKEGPSDNVVLTVKPSGSEERQHVTSQVISTIPSSASSFISPAFAENPTPAVTVYVINLYYPPSSPESPSVFAKSRYPDLRGFGYLIPNSIPFSQNPERALGVIFDSYISPDLHTTVAQEKLGTKLTVMMGGHWWDGWTEYPSEAEAGEMAQAVLARHLEVRAKPLVCEATLQRNCIPQYTVGHASRMAKVQEDMIKRWDGKVKLAGCSYNGVGINDCLHSAWAASEAITTGKSHTLAQGLPFTGLEEVVHPTMALVKRRKTEDMVNVLEIKELVETRRPPRL